MYPSIEVDAWADLLEAADPATRARLGLAVERHGGATSLRAAGIDHLLFNRLSLGREGAPSRAALATLLGAFETSGIDRYFVQVDDPVAIPLAGWLADLGVSPYRRAWVRYARSPSVPLPPVRTDLVVDRATPADAEAVARIVRRGFDLPEAADPLVAATVGRRGWHVYVAREGSTPVAAAGLHVRGDLGYLAFAATLPEFRGRGAQRALVARRIQVARGLGCARLFTETGEPIPGQPNPSEHNLVASGFVPVGRIVNHVPIGTTWLG